MHHGTEKTTDRCKDPIHKFVDDANALCQPYQHKAKPLQEGAMCIGQRHQDNPHRNRKRRMSEISICQTCSRIKLNADAEHQHIGSLLEDRFTRTA